MSDERSLDERIEALVVAIEEQSALIRRRIAQERNWKMQLGRGVLMGFGSVLGATVVVSLIVWVLKPLAHFETINNVLVDLQRRERAIQESDLQEQVTALEARVAELQRQLGDSTSDRAGDERTP
ncbi:MAG: DUF5665 domain-containing protein [Fimbriimonadaceae bacterium]